MFDRLETTILQCKKGNDIRVDPNYLSNEKPQRGDIKQRRGSPLRKRDTFTILAPTGRHNSILNLYIVAYKNPPAESRISVGKEPEMVLFGIEHLFFL